MRSFQRFENLLDDQSSTIYGLKVEASSLAEFGSIVLSTTDPLFSSPSFLTWLTPYGAATTSPLVSPKEIPAPKDSGLPLNAYMLHNPAHVELNAIDLAWDTVVRFSPFIEILGEGFFADFAHVSDDESRHFSWCAQRLAELDMVICQPTIGYGGNVKNHQTMLGCTFGCDPTSPGTPLRPSPSEAGGLDAGPRLVKKLVGFGDNRTSKIAARIADEEVAHVAVDLLKEYNVELKGPFNYSARDKSGIPGDWYDDASSASTKDKKDKDGNQKQLSAALGFSLGSSLRLSRPPRLNRWPRRLDSWYISTGREHLSSTRYNNELGEIIVLAHFDH
ncbi:hypothetical protein JHK85_038373 [Glycine max]|nr:hypothetical protein JHK85_038373 [Glycine max]